MSDNDNSKEGSKNFHNSVIKGFLRLIGIERGGLFLLAVIACPLVVVLLKITAPFILPIIIAVLLAFVVTPLLDIPSSFRFPRYASILLATTLIVAGMFFIGWIIFFSGKQLLDELVRSEEKINEIYMNLAAFFSLPTDEHNSLLQNMKQLWTESEVSGYVTSLGTSIITNFVSFIKDALMVVLFFIFLLFEAVFFRQKLEAAFESKTVQKINIIGTDIVRQVSRYLSIKFIISLVTGLIVAGLLHLTGLKFALVWGILQFLLNFIPTLGSIAIGVVISLFAMMQFWPDPQPIILVIAIMLGVNTVIGSIMDPKIMGDNLGLSPFVIILSLSVWGFLWGFVGMVIAVPMTVIIKIICENVPALKPISIFLGSRKGLIKKKQKIKQENKPETSDPGTAPSEKKG